MTLNELIDQLTMIADALDEGLDPEIRLATQPSYPLASLIGEITPDPDNDCVWLAESQHDRPDNPYAPSTAWDGMTL